MDLIKSIQAALGIYAPVDTTRTFGCDTSPWSGIVDFSVAKDMGMSFTIGKAQDGIVGPSKYFVENYNGAKKAGMITGMYSWLYKNSVLSTKKQAETYAELYRRYPTELPPTIDFEWTKSGNPTANVDLYDFLVRFEDSTGVKCQVYTAWGYWRQYGSTNNFYSNYPLWVAQYQVSEPNSFSPWGKNYTIWQYTDRAQSSLFGFPIGSESMCDMNYFNGTIQDLYDYCGLTEPIEPPIEPPIVIEEEVRVTVNSLRIREQPNTTSAIVGGLVYNQTIKPLEYRKVNVNTVWARIENPVVGWTCVLNNGLYYTTKKDYSDIPIYVPPVEPPLSKLGLYRIKDDLEAKTEAEGGTRPYIRNGLPSTVRLRGGKGFLQLSNEWMQYLYKINDTVKSKNYQFESHPSPLILKDRVGYHNFGEPNRVEQLTFSGNIVEVTKIESDKAYIKTYFNNEKPPEVAYVPKEKNLHPLVQLFTTQYKTGLDMSTDGRYPRTLIIANPGEQLWIDLRDIVKI